MATQPPRWRGPLGAWSNSIDVEEEEIYFDEMCDRITQDRSAVSPKKFHVEEEKLRAATARKYDWLVTLCRWTNPTPLRTATVKQTF